MILESIVTTTNQDGTTNISPMGPNLPNSTDGQITNFELRPFDTSRTFANLKRTKMGVLHVTDDVELFANTAIGRSYEPDLMQAEIIEGKFLSGACRAYEFRVNFIDETGQRMHLNCEVIKVHRLRDFWGFNRAKHAVLEAAILATRLDFLPKEEIAESFAKLKTTVAKTGGTREHMAFELLESYVTEEAGNSPGA